MDFRNTQSFLLPQSVIRPAPNTAECLMQCWALQTSQEKLNGNQRGWTHQGVLAESIKVYDP